MVRHFEEVDSWKQELLRERGNVRDLKNCLAEKYPVWEGYGIAATFLIKYHQFLAEIEAENSILKIFTVKMKQRKQVSLLVKFGGNKVLEPTQAVTKESIIYKPK